VIIGFFVILLGGRQGLVAEPGPRWGGTPDLRLRPGGLFLGYLYFSLPRAIASYTAAAGALDRAGRSRALAGRQPLAGGARRLVARLLPTTGSCAAMVFATAMGAFGTAFTLASRSRCCPSPSTTNSPTTPTSRWRPACRWPWAC
jgi:putative spermidine/putrescine transport system permease protein